MNSLLPLSPQELKLRLRELYRTDLYALLRYGLHRKDADNEWIFQRCREVQRTMNGTLDLWAREHYKSTVLTFAGSIFRIIRSHGDDTIDPREVTIGIFSHNRSIAKGFLRQIKYELETNDHLQMVFDDIFWSNPRKEASKWTEDEGITVKRKSNPKEATVEAHGLVDGQPTSKHYLHRQYDDVVTLESVTSPEMIAKTTQAYEMSDNLGTEGGTFSVVGTRYHFADTYGELIKRKSVKLRCHPCTIDGTENFTPENCVLMQPDTLRHKRINQGPYTFGTQMLLNPKGDNAQTLKREWLKYADDQQMEGLNVYIIVDPANAKRATNDYTSIWVIGLGTDSNYYALEIIRDRFNLTERGQLVIDLHRKYTVKGVRPLAVGYERYGMQADIQHIQHLMNKQNYRFQITELGGQTPKLDRIRRLIPIFEKGRFYLPRGQTYTNHEGKTHCLVETFINEEYTAFPVMSHDDMLDCLARIVDPEFPLQWPQIGGWAKPQVLTNGSIMRGRA
jgi:predicted phage terminase large subunit-like protein